MLWLCAKVRFVWQLYSGIFIWNLKKKKQKFWLLVIILTPLYSGNGCHATFVSLQQKDNFIENLSKFSYYPVLFMFYQVCSSIGSTTKLCIWPYKEHSNQGKFQIVTWHQWRWKKKQKFSSSSMLNLILYFEFPFQIYIANKNFIKNHLMSK